MNDPGLIIDHIPSLQDTLFIAGFEGWGNALDVSRGMVDYLIRTLEAEPFARLDSDPFYRYDESRPQALVKDGTLTSITPPGAAFFAASREKAGRDIILFRASEPHLQWYRFCEAILFVCESTHVGSAVTVGSMFDDVLHTDIMVSAFASNTDILSELEPFRISPVNYKGDSAIHSLLHDELRQRGIDVLSLWAHCPYYLQGTTHFGLLSHLGLILGSWGGFDIETGELDQTWRELNRQIQEIIEKNPELQDMISNLRKAKVKGSWEAATRHDNVIHLEDFLKPG
ncbi:MAG: PAC2 family protein [Thermodesulfobacteriota bacterium]